MGPFGDHAVFDHMQDVRGSHRTVAHYQNHHQVQIGSRKVLDVDQAMTHGALYPDVGSRTPILQGRNLALA
jgi:hypothetical protein